MNHVTDQDAEGALKTPIMLLDDISSGLAKVDLLKVDVEGYEMAVFQGGFQTLVKTKCIYFEICDEFLDRYGVSVKQLLTFLMELDFSLFVINEDYKMLAIDYSFTSVKHHQNIIATKNVNDLVRRTGWGMIS